MSQSSKTFNPHTIGHDVHNETTFFHSLHHSFPNLEIAPGDFKKRKMSHHIKLIVKVKTVVIIYIIKYCITETDSVSFQKKDPE